MNGQSMLRPPSKRLANTSLKVNLLIFLNKKVTYINGRKNSSYPISVPKNTIYILQNLLESKNNKKLNYAAASNIRFHHHLSRIFP
jgi:hypothetical protein